MKKVKSVVSVFLCAAMLVSMCAIGANAEDFVIDEEGDDVVTNGGYSVSVDMFVGSGGNVLIVNLINLTFSDTSDITASLFTVGTNDELTKQCDFAVDEIIVEQPNEYHDYIELYLKNDKVPYCNEIGTYVLLIESGSLTDAQGGNVSAIEYSFIPVNTISRYFKYEIDCEGSTSYEDEPGTIGNWITLSFSHGFKDRTNSITVMTDTPKTLSIRDKTTIDIIGAGDARFTVKYNDFVYEICSIMTYTKLGYFISGITQSISDHSVSSIGEYFNNITDALLFIVDIPAVTVAITIVAWPIAPITMPIVFVGLGLFYFVNIFCSFFGVKLIA